MHIRLMGVVEKFLLLKANMFLLEILCSNHGTLPGEIGISVETPQKHS